MKRTLLASSLATGLVIALPALAQVSSSGVDSSASTSVSTSVSGTDSSVSTSVNASAGTTASAAASSMDNTVIDPSTDDDNDTPADNTDVLDESDVGTTGAGSTSSRPLPTALPDTGLGGGAHL